MMNKKVILKGLLLGKNEMCRTVNSDPVSVVEIYIIYNSHLFGLNCNKMGMLGTNAVTM